MIFYVAYRFATDQSGQGQIVMSGLITNHDVKELPMRGLSAWSVVYIRSAIQVCAALLTVRGTVLRTGARISVMGGCLAVYKWALSPCPEDSVRTRQIRRVRSIPSVTNTG